MRTLPRRRVWPILGVLFGAPVCAEYLQAYLPATGDVLELVIGLIFLAPLYGGAALLIREVAVRTGRGWPGVLLLAGAFAVAMPGLIDLSAFTEHAEYTGWDELWAPTEAFGLSWHGTVTWSLAHVVMSIGVPLALLDALAPVTRGRPLLSRPGLVVTALAFVAVAALIRSDAPPDAIPTVVQTLCVLAVCGLLVLAALCPWGRPIARTRDGRAWGRATAFGFGVAVAAIVDLTAPTWTGLVLAVALASLAAAVLTWAARSTSWGLPQATAVACGALVGRTLVGFLAPLPPGVDLAAKLGQNVVLLVAAVLVVRLALARSSATARGYAGAGR